MSEFNPDNSKVLSVEYSLVGSPFSSYHLNLYSSASEIYGITKVTLDDVILSSEIFVGVSQFEPSSKVLKKL